MDSLIKTVVTMGTGYIVIGGVKKIVKSFYYRRKATHALKLSTAAKIEVEPEVTANMTVKPESQTTAETIATTPLIELIPTDADGYILLWETMKQMVYDKQYNYSVLNMEAFAKATCQKFEENAAKSSNELSMLEKPLVEVLNSIRGKVSYITDKLEKVLPFINHFKFKGIVESSEILNVFVARTSSDRIEQKFSVFHEYDGKGRLIDQFYSELMGASMSLFIEVFDEEGSIDVIDEQIKTAIKAFTAYEGAFKEQRRSSAELQKFQDYMAGQKDIQLLIQQEKLMENNPVEN